MKNLSYKTLLLVSALLTNQGMLLADDCTKDVPKALTRFRAILHSDVDHPGPKAFEEVIKPCPELANMILREQVGSFIERVSLISILAGAYSELEGKYTQSDFEDTLQKLIHLGADITQKDMDFTALDSAISHANSFPIARILLKHGAMPSERTFNRVCIRSGRSTTGWCEDMKRDLRSAMLKQEKEAKRIENPKVTQEPKTTVQEASSTDSNQKQATKRADLQKLVHQIVVLTLEKAIKEGLIKDDVASRAQFLREIADSIASS